MIRRLVVAVSAAIVAGTAATLALAAADAWVRDGTAVLVALAAVFITQPLYVLARRTAPKDRP